MRRCLGLCALLCVIISLGINTVLVNIFHVSSTSVVHNLIKLTTNGGAIPPASGKYWTKPGAIDATSSLMRAAVFNKHGKTIKKTGLHTIPNAPIPPFSANEVLVRVVAASLNPVDWKSMQGYLAPVQKIGSFLKGDDTWRNGYFIPGFDLSGIVVAVGDAVHNFTKGDSVYAMQHFVRCSSFSEYTTVAQQYLAKKPTGFTHQQAAALPLVGLTSLQALKHAGVGEGSKVLILGGSTATGMVGIQIAKALGATKIHTTCGKRNFDLVERLGANSDGIVDYRTQRFSDVLPADYYDAVYDCAGGIDNWEQAKIVLRSGRQGSFVTIVGDKQEALTPKKVMTEAITMGKRIGAWALGFGNYYTHYTCNSDGEDLRELTLMVERKQLTTIIDSTFSLDRVAEAFKRSMRGKNITGKIVIDISEKSSG